MAARLKVKVGLTSVRSPRYPSEPAFVKMMNDQVAEIVGALTDIMEQTGDVSPEIAMDALEPTFEKSKVYCPKDTHELVNSGYLEIVRRGPAPYVEMGYAKGGKPRYAPYVHEITSYRHEAPTRSKWLQHAVQEDMGSFQSRLAEGYRRFLTGGVVGKRKTRKKK